MAPRKIDGRGIHPKKSMNVVYCFRGSRFNFRPREQVGVFMEVDGSSHGKFKTFPWESIEKFHISFRLLLPWKFFFVSMDQFSE